MITYIKYDIQGFYVDFPEEIDPIYWEGMIGKTLDDFYNNKWVKLSSEQIEFHNTNPEASIKEVFNMKLDPIIEPDPIELAKQIKLKEIEDYDTGNNVNDFTINNIIHDWFTPEKRSNYRNSIEAAEIMGKDNLSLFINNDLYTISTQSAKLMLAQIQLYADQCYIVTQQHKTAINSLFSIEEINNYDYTQGYPEKLNFNI